MTLHFSLKDIFGLCVVLMIWNLVMPAGTIWTAAAYFGAVLAYLQRRRRVAAEDGTSAADGFSTEGGNRRGGCVFRSGAGVSAADGILAAAFLFNLWYVLGSWGNVRQYDYYNFVMHTDYFLQNGFFLAAPAAYLQSVYFQPPLWGVVSAAVTKFCMWFGAGREAAFDSVRFVSLFCITGAGIVFWRLLREFKLKDGVRLGLFALFCFFPAHGITANLVNNDAAVYFLMTAMIYCGYRWYVSGRWREALVLAGLLLAAGLVKFSGLMMLPALGMLGLFRLVQAANKLSLRLWGQFAVIGAGAAVGFAWGWFLLAYDFPLVPPPVGNAFQDLRSYGLAERLSCLTMAGEVFADVRAGLAEPNVWLALIKTSLFGEWSWGGVTWAYLLYVLGIGLAILLAASFFTLPFYKLGEGWGINAFAVVLVFSVLGAWANFWLEYPYFCSSEYRYVMILLPVSLLWLGNFLTQKSLPKAVGYVLAGGVALMVLARFMLYLNTI